MSTPGESAVWTFQAAVWFPVTRDAALAAPVTSVLVLQGQRPAGSRLCAFSSPPAQAKLLFPSVCTHTGSRQLLLAAGAAPPRQPVLTLACAVGVKWCLSVVLIYMSLVTNGDEDSDMFARGLQLLFSEVSAQAFRP